MSEVSELVGQTILLVEDDYFVAFDTAAALREAGAEVLGPCPTVEAARQLLEDRKPQAALLDLNLGDGGPSFEIARLTRELGLPFVFLTGYDSAIIPEEFADVPVLHKPVPLQDIVKALGALTPSA